MQFMKTTAKSVMAARRAMAEAKEAAALAKIAKEVKAAEAAKKGAQAAHRMSEASKGAQGVAKIVEKKGPLPKDIIPLDRRAGRRVEQMEKEALARRKARGEDPGEYLDKVYTRETRKTPDYDGLKVEAPKDFKATRKDKYIPPVPVPVPAATKNEKKKKS